MPYVKPEVRTKFFAITSSIDSLKIEKPEELSYLIRLYVDKYVHAYRNDWNYKFTFLEDCLSHTFIDSRGELNYLITKTIKSYMDYHGEKYDHYDDVINVIERVKDDLNQYKALWMPVGTLECVKMELYRKLIAPYEEKKEKENGIVY